MSEPTAAAPVETQPKPEDRRRALFAAAGERIYLIEKLQAEVNTIRAELDGEQPSYPPKTQAPAPKAPTKKARPKKG